MKTLTCTLAFATVLLGGCATSYSELSGARYHQTPIDTYPVTVTRIDGQSTPLHGRTLVDPGRRSLVLQGPPTLTSRNGSEVRIELDVKPCTRYYLVAVKENRLANDFAVKVDHEEPIGACTPPAG